MKKIKKFSILALIGMTLLTLSGCNKEKDISISDSNKEKNVYFSDSNDSRVWLMVYADKEQPYPIAKENTINVVFQTKNGKCRTFKTEGNGFTLEKIANMKDSEIISKAEELDEKNFNKDKKRVLEDFDNNAKYYIKNTEELESTRKKLDGITYQTPSWEDISITLKKDNNKETLEEEIPILNKIFDENEGIYKTVNGVLRLSVPVATTEVLGQYYTGYATENGKTLLITRVDKDYQKMALDKKETN